MLVCAPSNAAADSIAERLIKGPDLGLTRFVSSMHAPEIDEKHPLFEYTLNRKVWVAARAEIASSEATNRSELTRWMEEYSQTARVPLGAGKSKAYVVCFCT